MILDANNQGELQSSLFEDAPVAWVLLSDLKIVKANLLARINWGATLGSDVVSLVSSDDVQKVINVLADVNSSTALEVRAASGGWCRLTFSCYLSFVQIVIVDTSVIHSLELEKKTQQQQLWVAETLAGVGSYTLDVVSGTWESSALVAAIFGIDNYYPRTFAAWAELLHPDDAALAKATIVSLITGSKVSFDMEYKIVRHSDKRVCWIRSCGIRDGDSIIGTLKDVSQAHEENLKIVKLQTAVEQNANTIIITDVCGNIEYANPAFEVASGYAISEVLGKNPNLLKSGEQPDSFYRDLWETILSGRTWRGQFKNRKKCGEFYWESATISPVFDKHGKLVNFIAIKEDITKAKQREDEIYETNAKLVAATEAKSEFLAAMSHEIRTPINGIIGLTDLLLDTELQNDQREFLGSIKSCGDSLLTLVNEILDLSKVEAGQIELEAIDFDLRSTIEDVIELLAYKGQQKGLDTACLIAEDVPEFLRGDPGRLRQILFNIVGNSIKFTEHGGIAVNVTTDRVVGDIITLRFTISDTGIGIPADKLDSIFSKFTQADTSTSRKYGGTGLGLAISKQLIQLYNGDITVRSQLGKGSVFTFTLDLVGAGVSTVSVQEKDLKGTRILIADDFAPNRLLMSNLLRAWGSQTEEAENAEEAMHKLEVANSNNAPFDIVLVDMQMPVMNGAELGMKIKSNATLMGTQLIMLTSLGARGDAERLKGIGFAGYLTKPIRPNVLKRCISLVLGKQATGVDDGHLVTRHVVKEVIRQKLRILVVEDNPINSMIAIKMLEKLGHIAEAAGNGEEAVAAVQKFKYHIVFMDCQMPVMDGFEATKIIRSLDSPVRDVPIIAFTAHAIVGYQEQCLRAGMNGYVAKPAAQDALELAINKVMKAHSVAEPEDAKIDKVSNDVIFDKLSLLVRLGDDIEIAKEIVAMYLEETPLLLKELKGAIDEKDYSMVTKVAHNIKGVSANVGAQKVSNLAELLQKHSASDDLTDLFARLDVAYCEFEGLAGAELFN